jgi:hypothetical protein
MKFACRLLILGFLARWALVASGAGTEKPAPRATDAACYTITINDFDFSPRN